MPKQQKSNPIDPRESLNSIAQIIDHEIVTIANTGTGNLDALTAGNLVKYASALTDMLKAGEKVDAEVKKTLGALTVEELEQQLASLKE